MPDGREPTTIRVLGSILDVPAAQWDACVGADNPFLGHAFLATLELSGSATGESGWLPQHLAIDDDSGRLAACAPLYLKSHSYGEYVFDWSWAEAYQRAGGRYYPKLQSAVPFTPVAGRRLLVRPDAPVALADALAHGMVQLAQRLGVSSLHVTFPTEAEGRRLGEAGYLLRIGRQFHWQNRGYGSFEDFLARLSSRKRKAIRRERRAVAESGITFRTLTGDNIDEAHWDSFWSFYLDTTGRKWGPAYLTRRFFSLLGERLAERVVLVLAESRGRTIAGALNMLGPDTLYGRNWGCIESHPFLHFETCYYQAIEFAIARGLARVEAGAQGEHKIQRGYLPVTTSSAHWIADAKFRRAVAHFLSEERAAIESEMRALAQVSPYRSDSGPGINA